MQPNIESFNARWLKAAIFELTVAVRLHRALYPACACIALHDAKGGESKLGKNILSV